MGRKTLYLTEDEKKEAKRARDKRYYEEQRLKICAKKQEVYAAAQQRAASLSPHPQSVGANLHASSKHKPAKYTDEERRLRNRQKSGLWYQRNKSKIQARRRTGGPQPQVDHQDAVQPVLLWKQEKVRLAACLKRCTGGMGTYEYVGGLVRRLRVNSDARALEKALTDLESLLSAVQRLQADVLQVFGCREEMQDVRALYLQAHSVIQCLEDVQCYVLQGDLENALVPYLCSVWDAT
ncbi:hypothetical protein MD484_g6466, partial [Candolleomyces efflorescens]